MIYKPIIFLSYIRSDQDKVKSLYQYLNSSGFEPWMDKHNIYGGEDWKRAIDQALREADFVLICLSRQSYDKRGYLQREIKLALDQWQEMLPSDIFLIPVRLEDCPVPEALSDYQWVDYFESDGKVRLVNALKEGLKRRGKLSPEIIAGIAEDTEDQLVVAENVMDKRKKLNDLLAEDEIDQVIQQLDTVPGMDKTQLILLKNRWSSINHDSRYGIITREEFETEKRQLIKIILDIIDKAGEFGN